MPERGGSSTADQRTPIEQSKCARLGRRPLHSGRRKSKEGRMYRAEEIGIGGAVACSPLPHHRTGGSAYGGSASCALTGRRFDSSFATRASPLCRLPFRLHRLLNLQNSAKLIGWRSATREFDVLLLTLTVWAFLTFVSTTPAADFCCRISVSYSTLSLESETCNRSPAISSTAFDTRPPDLPPASLMDTDFAILCPLVRRRRPLIQFLSIGPYLCSRFLQTPPHGDALALRYPSPPSGWDGTSTR